MGDDRMQLQRWELKYVIPEELALAVRDFVRSYLELDEYGAKRSDLSYTIHNLYLDSDDLAIYWGTINGDKNRYKLRLRFYEDNSHAPVFFEIKRRTNDAIIKQRGGVKRFAVEAVLAGQIPSPAELVSGDPRQLVAIQRFVELASRHRAAPVAHVRYDREAWISVHDNSVRVTMDRNVLIAPEFVTRFTDQLDDPTSVFGNLVILELKFTGRFPDWFKELVRIFNLRQSSASKYADGIVRKGEHYFYRNGLARFRSAEFAAGTAIRKAHLARLDNLALAPA
ncbi:MAG TPA: polyphosphate polymerase domain-containing protein [Verrucomicrobiota bacterium]|nr:polyphosphate polymerase domain-containing protein [Verrucomicrobiota bacterium]